MADTAEVRAEMARPRISRDFKVLMGQTIHEVGLLSALLVMQGNNPFYYLSCFEWKLYCACYITSVVSNSLQPYGL